MWAYGTHGAVLLLRWHHSPYTRSKCRLPGLSNEDGRQPKNASYYILQFHQRAGRYTFASKQNVSLNSRSSSDKAVIQC